MPQMIQMRALVAFDRNGTKLKAGDLFTVFPIEAASLRYKKQAEFAQGAKAAAPPATPPKPEPPATSPEAPTQQAAPPLPPHTAQAKPAHAEETASQRRRRAAQQTGAYERRDISASE